jgi:hypothetical protein
MKKILLSMIFIVLSTWLINCSNSESEFQSISLEVLKDKIRGGWAGKMIGVSYGGPTEFGYNSVINEDPIDWNPESLRRSIGEDDLYVQMSFMMTMDEHGIDAPAEKFAESFANAGYMLFHANRKGRKNFWDGIMHPMSGHPDYSLHADDIDFQIEADYIGFMCPGMPQTSNEICDKIGHIMNYGDGVYGGMFVSALYAASYFESDIQKVLQTAIKSLPPKSAYARIVNDVIDGYKRNPDDWRETWHELQKKWGEDDICGALDPFNIDAKLNGAYIVMGMLYGEGDFEKTMEISTRCGQDSDCNPSNASGVIGILSGYNNIPTKWTQYIDEIADSTFIYTDYSFNKAVERTLHYARELIIKNGGKVDNGVCSIIIQKPVAAKFEQSFTNVKGKYRTTIEDKEGWQWKGDWHKIEHRQWGSSEQQMIAEKKGSEVIFSFNGTGAVIMGRWDKDGGKSDVYVDGELVREIDNYYWMMNRGAGFDWLNGAHLFHVLSLEPGDHTIGMVINGKKNEKSEGTKIRISRAIVYDQIK